MHFIYCIYNQLCITYIVLQPMTICMMYNIFVVKPSDCSGTRMRVFYFLFNHNIKEDPLCIISSLP